MRTDIWKGIAAVGMLLLMGKGVQAQCPNTAMAVTQVAAGCGADVSFMVTNDIGFQSVQWTVDGEPFSSQQAGIVFFNPGTYVFEALTVGTDMCTSLMEEEITILPPFTAALFNDTIACNGNLGGIGPQVSGGSGDYSFQWDPAASVSDPTAQYPMITASFPQWITVSVTDNVTGCTASDSLYFYPNIQTNATVELCSGMAELTLDPGSMVYNWTAEDPDGNPIDMSGVTGNSFTATEVGTYEVMTYYSGCNQVVHEFEVVAQSFSIGISSNGNPPYACFGDCYYVSASGMGGTPPYTYLWSDLSVLPTLEACVGGVFHVIGTDASGCTSTASINIPGCPDECNSWISFTQNCHQVCFSAEGSHEIETYIWDFGDGLTSTVDEPCHIYAAPGTYEVTLIAMHENGCTSTYTVSVVIAEFMQVTLEDTVYTCSDVCEGTAMAIATGGTPPYTYFWPTNGFTIPTNTSLCSGTSTVEIWDADGCMVSADVVVMEFPIPELEITYSVVTENCATELCFQTESGFASYSWLANSGATSNGQSFYCFTVVAPGTYWVQLLIEDANGCSHLFASEQVTVDPCPTDVWPGDVNFDGIADNEDALWLGLAFDQTGPVRPDASLAWEGQPAPVWNFNFSQNSVNVKHADCDGNGVVNFADTIAINLNYGQTHGKTENGLAGNFPALWVEAVQDTVAPGQGIHATVHLGSASQPVDSLHGIAFTLTFNDMLVDDAAFSIDFSGNALGTVGSDVMTLQKLFLPDGEVDVAVTRTTRQNWGGYGPLATFHIVTTDNLSGIHELRIGVSGITAITANEFPVELASVPDTVIIDPDHVGIGEAFGSSLRVWPNPGSGIFRIEGLHGAELVEVMDATGRTISRRATNGPDALTIDLSEQPGGLYMLRLSGRDGVAVRRLVKSQ